MEDNVRPIRPGPEELVDNGYLLDTFLDHTPTPSTSMTSWAGSSAPPAPRGRPVDVTPWSSAAASRLLSSSAPAGAP